MSKEYQTGYYAYQAGDYRRAQSFWKLAAEEDDPYAQYALGLMYFRGDLGKPEYAMAAGRFIQAAKANHGGATYYLGLLHFNGYGLSYDHFRATKYFKRALEIDPQPVASFQQRQAAAGSRFRRGIEDRWRARCA